MLKFFSHLIQRSPPLNTHTLPAGRDAVCLAREGGSGQHPLPTGSLCTSSVDGGKAKEEGKEQPPVGGGEGPVTHTCIPLWFITGYWISLCSTVGFVVYPFYICQLASANPTLPIPALLPSSLAVTSLFSVSMILFHRYVHLCHILDPTSKWYGICLSDLLRLFPVACMHVLLPLPHRKSEREITYFPNTVIFQKGISYLLFGQLTWDTGAAAAAATPLSKPWGDASLHGSRRSAFRNPVWLSKHTL